MQRNCIFQRNIFDRREDLKLKELELKFLRANIFYIFMTRKKFAYWNDFHNFFFISIEIEEVKKFSQSLKLRVILSSCTIQKRLQTFFVINDSSDGWLSSAVLWLQQWKSIALLFGFAKEKWMKKVNEMTPNIFCLTQKTTETESSWFWSFAPMQSRKAVTDLEWSSKLSWIKLRVFFLNRVS